MRTGVRLGVDVGRARIGLARTDPHAMLATPVETVRRADDGSDLARIAAVIAELEPIEIVVGLPLSMSGAETASTTDSREFAARLAALGDVPVRLVDERLTTVSAQSALHRSGRTTRSSRQVIDQVAAVILVQHAIDAERSTGSPPGSLVPASPQTPSPTPEDRTP
ncbi:putative pre-16S rRNA nuclease [Cnuibacter physcomitrellae]|uniref:Putative pre-16S rRNA nuclease n=1 Tax=Cnuibacter physcomitrellae TaxID=1619308 RepID=A0A1X9LJN3_9MICO|nr:Holliday junction resolvase RuvX [Cnuibacter physcomitrellae]ARJ05416.1 Holliday junction resolvase RuvX [Cnuibacter physcomitrellae]GGI35655.1 putative pre-16S rRNA nuclease [Cnuibacter physcomitrellae]